MHCCRDAIEDGVTGLLLPAPDAIALAQAIIKMLENRESRQWMGKAGWILADKQFSVVNIVAEHLEIYRELGVTA